MKDNITLISGTANQELAEKIADNLGVELTPVKIKRFNDGETYARIGASVRSSHVFVIQPTSPPVNDNLMELLIMIDALKRASAKEITAVIPYFGYSRQDRKAASREPITAKLVSSLLEKAGVNRVITVDLHADQIQGYFDIPVDNLVAMPILAKYILDKKLDDMIVVAPDAGGTTRARRLAKSIFTDMAIIDKRRSAHGESQVMNLIGEVEGKTAILIDDMIDTGGTIVNAAKELKARGAKQVFICATHAILSKDAIDKLSIDEVEEVILTDTINIAREKMINKIKIVSLSSYISEDIRCIVEGRSMGEVIEGHYDKLVN